MERKKWNGVGIDTLELGLIYCSWSNLILKFVLQCSSVKNVNLPTFDTADREYWDLSSMQ